MNYLEKKNEEKERNKIKRYRAIWSERLLDLANSFNFEYELVDKFFKSLSYEEFKNNFYYIEKYRTIKQSIDYQQTHLILFKNIKNFEKYNQYIRIKKLKKIIE